MAPKRLKVLAPLPVASKVRPWPPLIAPPKPKVLSPADAPLMRTGPFSATLPLSVRLALPAAVVSMSNPPVAVTALASVVAARPVPSAPPLMASTPVPSALSLLASSVPAFSVVPPE
ncbi:Uncharacterised protein [Xylophilus ampelinus]|nr:Uncharacterised protein [Xylophilus ampelinus]